MSSFLGRLDEVTERIAAAARRSGRSETDVTLIPVTKNVEVARIAEAVKAGLTRFGENRVQEAMAKAPLLPPSVEWHLVGTLQRNKARHAVGLFSMVHSLDRVELASELARRCAARGVSLDVLVQVNMGRESQKSGVMPEGTRELLEVLTRYQTLRVRGLMIMTPLCDDPESVRPLFREGRILKEELGRLRLSNVELEHLSMGMSGDFEVAIEEGATMVRIGTALFGPRPVATLDAEEASD